MEKTQLSKPFYHLNTELLEKDLAIVQKESFGRFIRRRIPLFMDGYRYATYAVSKRWGIDVCFFEAGHEQVKSCYMSNMLNAQGAEVWLEKLKQDPAFAQSLVQELKQIVVSAKTLAQSIPQRDLTVEETEQCLMNHLSWWIDYFEIGFLWFGIENMKVVFDCEIETSWGGSTDDLKSFLENVYRPMNLPLSSVEQRDLLILATRIGDQFESELVAHCEKYKHLSLHNPDDEYFDLAYYRERAKLLQDPIEYQKQKDLLASADAEIVEAAELLKNSNLSDQLKERVEFVRWFMYLRTESIDHMMLVNSALKSVLNSLVQKLDLSSEAVLHMTYEEIIRGLHDQHIDRALIAERLDHGYAYLIAPNASYLVTGKDVDALDALVIPKRNEEKITELKGQIAFKGKVTGIARVILDRRDSKDLLEGEILVTTMTSPEFVPAMKLSAGIITNEGGILCHAAIMSRELRKPCIIGTKIGTDAIKTGQTITLDADKGIITFE